MADITVECTCPEDVARRMLEFANAFPNETGDSAWEELTLVMNESKKLCPVEYNFLRTSGYVTDPVVMADGTILISIGYSSEYAVYVHEIVTNYHKPPTMAKFLELPLIYRRDRMLRNIIARINSKLGRSGA